MTKAAEKEEAARVVAAADRLSRRGRPARGFLRQVAEQAGAKESDVLRILEAHASKGAKREKAR